MVLDEADDLQKKDDGGHIPKLNAQIKRGRKDRVQTLFFSATLHTPEVQELVKEISTEKSTLFRRQSGEEDLKFGPHEVRTPKPSFGTFS